MKKVRGVMQAVQGVSKVVGPLNGKSVVAYFSMEVGVDPSMPTYAGGLGVLAGDTLRAAADSGVPFTCVTLVHHKGYYRQHLDTQGNQMESPAVWPVEEFLEPMEPRVSVSIEGRQVQVRAWRYNVRGILSHQVPVYFLDTDIPENNPRDRAITDYLYGGDQVYRLSQEVVLGIGGVAMLRALGYNDIKVYHMNEGHSALLTMALLSDYLKIHGHDKATEADIEAIRRRCVFTTHTPVPAGHDKFHADMVRWVLGPDIVSRLVECGCLVSDQMNMTYLGLRFSHYVNGVSLRHEEVAKTMYPDYPINSISNGVHAATWISPAFRDLFDRLIPEWRHDNLYLRYAVSIPLDKILQAHSQAKHDLIAEVERRTYIKLDPAALTIGFARRAATYKRAALLLSDPERLCRIVHNSGPIQIIYAGKAHPCDEGGKDVIRKVFGAVTSLADKIRIVYLEDYDMALAKLICSGVDLWLNTPKKPEEASGTSGMKAALNGVPSFSILDGWWVEGHVEGVTGWAIGYPDETENDPIREIESLYDKLEYVIIPMFYSRLADYALVMRSCIAINGSYYNAQRMIRQYVENAYLPTREHSVLGDSTSFSVVSV